MSDKRDYYEVLGVPREASPGDLRKAYKKLALKFHPDRNNGCHDAAGRFKEVTEAYSVLSDDDKRRRYDQFGHAGVEGNQDFGGDIFTHVQDLFSDFFGGFGGFGRTRRGPARGRDLRVAQTLSFEEAALGCKKEVEIVSPTACVRCNGSGARPGSSPTTCGTCGGRGQISTGRGFIMFTQACPHCHGEGKIVSDPCDQCHGSGWEEKRRTVTVSFPAGIDEGHRLRIAGQGMPGAGGGPPGHLYVDVHLQPHPRFEREGNELITRRRITFAEAALGTSLNIELLDGSTCEVPVEPGTQPGTVLTRPGRGIPSVNGHGIGALHVIVELDVPKQLSRRAKKLLRELEEELGTVGDAARSAS
jgi:molecular chaperone DnaJ